MGPQSRMWLSDWTAVPLPYASQNTLQITSPGYIAVNWIIYVTPFWLFFNFHLHILSPSNTKFPKGRVCFLCCVFKCLALSSYPVIILKFKRKPWVIPEPFSDWPPCKLERNYPCFLQALESSLRPQNTKKKKKKKWPGRKSEEFLDSCLKSILLLLGSPSPGSFL